MKTTTLSNILLVALVLAVAGAGVLSGCSEDNPLSSAVNPSGDDGAFETSGKDSEMIRMWGDSPPAGLVSTQFLGEELEFWPYTGRSFDGTTVDPINLVFVGQADPVRIRAALFALDGDRTAFGFPDAPPFNQTWSEAIGDVQTNFAEGDGWTGSVIQLQLGDYQPLRVHLRLFATNHAFGADGEWTLGGAHFEALIPGTTDHQVLSWEIAEQVVMVDLLRSGLLEPAAPMMPTGPINQAPSYREIPEFIYNELPPELRFLLTGSIAPSPVPVPLASDGQGTILNLAGEAPLVPGHFTQSQTIQFAQVIPMPLCMDGPYDWVQVTGPVEFLETVDLDAAGNYSYHSNYKGSLQVTPMDITQSPPVPIGETFKGIVSGVQDGRVGPGSSRVIALDRRIAPQDGGAELLLTRLKVGSTGRDSYRSHTACLTDGS